MGPYGLYNGDHLEIWVRYNGLYVTNGHMLAESGSMHVRKTLIFILFSSEGMLSNKFGGKITSACGILGFGVFNILTPSAAKLGGLPLLIAVKILEGLVEVNEDYYYTLFLKMMFSNILDKATATFSLQQFRRIRGHGPETEYIISTCRLWSQRIDFYEHYTLNST